VYYVSCPGHERDMSLFRMDPGTRQRLPIGRLRSDGDGIAVSPRGWPILYTEEDTSGDLMLIENFR
jgi:hypothetical protein